MYQSGRRSDLEPGLHTFEWLFIRLATKGNGLRSAICPLLPVGNTLAVLVRLDRQRGRKLTFVSRWNTPHTRDDDLPMAGVGVAANAIITREFCLRRASLLSREFGARNRSGPGKAENAVPGVLQVEVLSTWRTSFFVPLSCGTTAARSGIRNVCSA